MARSPAIAPNRSEVGECTEVAVPGGIRVDENIDCGSQEEDVEDVNVVVLPFGLHFGEVQVPKKEICTVEREKSSGNEVLHCVPERGSCPKVHRW